MIRRAVAGILIALPVLTAILWLYSGRELLTKSGKPVTVSVKDELFGGGFSQERVDLVRGPILGYYVGLDLVVAVTVTCLIAGLVAWWIFRWRARHKERMSTS